MPFVEGGIVVDAEPQQQAAPQAARGGFVPGGITVDAEPQQQGYGLRPDGTQKGTGFLGELALKGGGVATEYSIQSEAVKQGKNMVDFPTLVPTLTKDEVDLMLNDIIPNDKAPPESIIQKAIAHANERIGKGLSPFATQGGFVEGGITADPTPEDSYNKVLQFQAAQTDYTPSKQEFLDYLKVSKTKPLLGEKPLETIGTAAVQTAKDIATMPYKLGEAIGQIYQPPEGATEGDVALGTAAEIAAQSKLKAQSMARGAYDVALSNLEKLTGKLRSDDDRYEAFLATSEIKRQLARANAPEEQRVPAAQEFLQAYNIPQEAISQPGLEVGGFLADPSSIAFAGGGKAASALLQRALPLIPRAGQMLQRGGERISTLGQAPETGAGALATKITGSPQMGQAVQEAIAKGTTGVALGEAAGLPITAQLNVPGLGTASQIIGGTKALGATLETIGEAGAVSGGPALTAIQRGLLGTGERIAAAEGASAGAKAFGNAIARSGLEAPIKGAGAILVPMVGAGVGGAALAGLTGEEGDAIAAAFGSGAAFGAFDAGFHLAKAASADAFKGGRVRQTAVDDLNTRPTEVQFTYVDPVAGEQTSTIKDSEARATLYGRLNNKQLTKALSEVAGAESAGVDVIFHTDADTVPTALQTVNYAGVSIGPKNIKSGRPTILINVDRATPEAIPHEILHAKITQDVISQLGSKVIESMIRSEESPNEATKFEKQFTEFATNYAEKIKKSGGAVISDEILTELRDGFDTSLQRAQRIEALKRITDEFSAYYTQEMLKGKDPKTMLPGRIPSFIEMALNNAKEAVSERFTRRALQAGFDPVARSFYDANGRRIKIDWMEDAIKNLVTPKEGYEPTEQKVDINKMTKAQQNALIMARGYSDLFMTAPDGSIVRPLSKAELAAKTADVANRTMKVVESVPQADRTSVSGMDAKGNPVIEGRLSLAEADAVSKSGIFSPSTSRSLIDIAMGIRDGTLMEAKYWKVYGPTGKSGVFGESEKLFLPYGISINSKGGVNVKVVDWGKVQARMYKALTKPAYQNLFRNYDQAMSTLKDVYLKNIAEQNAAPSAEALGGGLEGAKKRNFFNEVMGSVPKKGDVMSNLPTAGYVANRKGGSVYQDLRIERLQNTNPTGAKIPWTGDMGEQSSYRRTQLNFQPAETIGETQVSTDQNGGYRILSKNGKFRLYGPDGSTAGIFDTEGQAKLKAEKDYATQARLQPEVRQQQYPVGNEVRQTAEAGGRNRAIDSTQGREEGRQELGAVRQAGDVRFMPDGKSAGLAVLDNELSLNLPKRPKVLDIANAFQDLFGKAIEYRKSNPQDNAKLVKSLAQEIQRAVDLHPEAKGWYDENIKLTMDVMRDLDPDLAKPENDFMFKVILAATSDGNKVGPQFQQTWKEYSNWKNTGKISGDFVSGDRIENIKGNLKMFNEMVNAIGWEKTKNFFTRKGTVKEVRQALMDTFGWTKKEAQGIGSSELTDEVVPFAVVLGPKLGSFFNNLYGDFSSVTMDRWFMRTIGRLTGTQVEPLAGAKVRDMRNKLRDAVSRLTPSQFELLGIKRGDLKGTSIDNAATTISGRFAKKSLRDTAKQFAESGESALEETRKFANALKKGLNPLVEAPIDGTHRRWIRERIAEVQKDLRSSGIELENADLQAVLWYLEKELYEKLNYRSKSGESDYASAASSLYQSVAGRPSDVYARGTGRVRAIGGDGRGNVMDSANGGQAPRQEVGAQRYMPSDTDYLSAVQQGDTQAAQRMVDEAAKAAGAINAGKPLYHGGNRTKTSFAAGATRSGMGLAYLTDNKRTAWKYALGGGINDEMSLADYRRQQLKKLPSREPTVQKLYVVGDVADFSSYQDRPSASQLIEMFGEGKMSNILEDYSSRYREELDRGDSVESTLQGALEEGGFVREDTDATAGVPELQFLAASGLLDSYLKKIGKNVIAYNDAEAGGKTYVVFDPTQLKSADPITKDDAGNVIPLSQRFKATSEDIRFMPSPDSSMPGAYTFTGGYRALPGKTKGSLRLYGPAGSLLGIASSLDEAQRILRRKAK